ncbi:MAG: hypothetical protein LKF77_00020 [Proteus vulgaris]|jgi:hypothetical protein|nr:hypothetical protein [Proteus vulgaris]
MDKSRQQFEAFISKGDYPWVKGIIPVMWMVWEASRESLEKERDEAIKHLILVFQQYANNDHLFMSAGEDACEFLDNLGYGIDTGRTLELTEKGKQLIEEDWE